MKLVIATRFPIDSNFSPDFLADSIYETSDTWAGIDIGRILKSSDEIGLK